jgi:hypothetical protein
MDTFPQISFEFINGALGAKRKCTGCGFWDTGLKPTQRWRQFEAASAEIGLA